MEIQHSIVKKPVLKALFLLFILLFLSCQEKRRYDNEEYTKRLNENVDITVKGEMVAELTAPPFVPEPVGNRPAKVLFVDMEVLEEEGEMDDGVTYVYWTFGGSVPGSFIRCRVGDQVEFTLKNHPDNKLPHNIDLHAVTGQGGGAEASFIAPGQQKTFSFKAINPGLYVYHCATAPVGMHIANGMYGLIMVEPVGGLPKVDREYYVMQGDFYTKGKHGEEGLQQFDMEKAYDERPDYVVFNGKVGSLMGDNALQAKVGETVRLFVGNGGPNLVSSFHVIGEIFDKVYVEGGDLINHNVQTTLIPAGGAAIVEFTVETPAHLILVDHSIFRAFNKGALGMLTVTGDNNAKVFSGEIMAGIYHPEGGVMQRMPNGGEEDKPAEDVSKEERITRGKKVYMQSCFACHQAEGQGLPKTFPPLASADYLNADIDRAIKAVVNGLKGEITVNGEKYDGMMPAQQLSDEEVANVMTYVYNNWGNNGTEVTPERVKKNRM